MNNENKNDSLSNNYMDKMEQSNINLNNNYNENRNAEYSSLENVSVINPEIKVQPNKGNSLLKIIFLIIAVLLIMGFMFYMGLQKNESIH